MSILHTVKSVGRTLFLSHSAKSRTRSDEDEEEDDCLVSSAAASKVIAWLCLLLPEAFIVTVPFLVPTANGIKRTWLRLFCA